MTDLELLREYGRSKAQGAFEELARRHLDWVYSAAVRQVRDRQLAEDVTQAVFIALARKAGKLHGDRPLSSWLMTVTRCAAINAVRAEGRRRRREQEAAAMRQESAGVEAKAEWEEIAPVLDEQVLRLKQKDRDAVMLRFYERKSFEEVGQALGISEEAARKRVDRAVEQLRARMAEKGVTIGAGTLAVVVSEQLVKGAPPELMRSVVAGGGAETGAAEIAKGALSMMTLPNVKGPALPAIPDEVKKMAVEEQKAWFSKWLKTAEGQAWTAEYRAYTAATTGVRYANGIRGDGVFDLVEVPPGKYRMMISVSALNSGPSWGEGKALGWLQQEIVVPEEGAGKKVDLGRFVLKAPEERGR